MTIATLRALQATLASAIDEIEGVYKAQSSDFPTLEKPYYPSVTPHPDAEKAETLRLDPTVFAAANRIVAACGQVTATVHKPWFTLIDTVTASALIAYLRFVEETHIVDILRTAGPEGLSVEEIAKTIDHIRKGPNDSNSPALMDPAKISHILRALATAHWMTEVKPDVFANNRISSSLDTGKTIEQLKNFPEKRYDGSNGVAAYLSMTADDYLKTTTGIVDWLLETGGAPKEGQPQAPLHIAFGTTLNYYSWLEQPGNEHRLARFGHAMNGSRQWEVAENVLGGFPWVELPKDSVVVDVGGGIGSVSVMVAEAFPHLRFVVEDRAPVVAIAPQSWGSKHAALFSEGRVSFQAQDLFAPYAPFDVPGLGPVTSPALFLLRAIVHNWPDPLALEILKNVRSAAGPMSKLLLVDNLLPYACAADSAPSSMPDGADVAPLVPAGSILAPNLGRASLNGYLLDGVMMGMLNAKERTLAEMDALTRAAGWRIVSVKRAVGSLWAYITAEAV